MAGGASCLWLTTTTPATGMPGFGPVGGSGDHTVDPGWDQGGPASNACTIQINGRTRCIYSGVVTATVAVV